MFRTILFSLNLLIGFNLHSRGIADSKDTFEHIFRERWDKYVVIKNGLFGVVDTNYNLMVKPEYDFISPTRDGVYRVKKNNLWGILDANGRTIIPFIYEAVGPSGHNTFCAKQNGKWGLLDSLNRWLIPAEMDEKFEMEFDGLVKKNGRYGAISREGKVVIPIIYNKKFWCSFEEDCYKFKNGFFSKAVKYKPRRFEDRFDYRKDCLTNINCRFKSFQENGLYGLKNIDDSILLKPQFKTLLYFSEGLAFATSDSFHGYIDTNGRQVIRLGKQYYGRHFENSSANIYAATNCNIKFPSKIGSIDRKGSIIISPKYDWLSKYSNGRYRALQDSIILILDSNGQFIHEFRKEPPRIYQKMMRRLEPDLPYKEDEFAFFYDAKMGFINNQGEEITGMKYDLVYRFDSKNDLLIVKKDDDYGLINTNGKSILPIEYESINHLKWMSSDLILKQDGKFGLFNIDDNSIIQCEYNNMRWESEGLIAVSKNGKWGFIDKMGKLIIPLEYDSVTNFRENESIVLKGDKKYKINRLNQVIP